MPQPLQVMRESFLRHPFWVFGVGVLGVTSVIAATIQLLVLPHLFPELHAGHGLLVGGDWVGFHEIAAELAARIHAQGWSVWELRPGGHSAAGIAAVVYALTVPEPYTLIPLNAALHAMAGVTLMRIARFLTDDDGSALCAALPFVLYPSAMAWYAQLHKESFYFAGAFLSLYGWVVLARIPTWQAGWRTVLTGVICIGAGIALMGLVRTYAFQVMQAMGYLFAVGLTVLFLVRGVRGALSWKACNTAITILLLVPVFLRLAPIDAKLSHEVAAAAPTSGSFADGALYAKDIWRASGWLPSSMENKFLWVAMQRDNYILREPGQIARGFAAGSLIDTDVRLSSASDFAAYIPRAVQIGLLAPFPAHWVGPGKSPGGSMMRRLAGLEMMAAYFALLFLPYAIWLWRRRIELWLSVAFGIPMILLYAYSTPNLGTLYRQRYGFLMLLVGVGLAGGLAALKPRVFRHAEKQ